MPRPLDIPRWRRFAMQAIMWVILAATVGVAALIDRRVELGTPEKLDGVELRLPKNWIREVRTDSTIELTESDDELARRIRVKVGLPASLMDSLRALAGDDEYPPMRTMRIEIGSQPGTLVIRKHPVPGHRGFYLVQVSASSMIPPGDRKLTITLEEVSGGRQAETDSDLSLVQRMAASVRFDEPARE